MDQQRERQLVLQASFSRAGHLDAIWLALRLKSLGGRACQPERKLLMPWAALGHPALPTTVTQPTVPSLALQKTRFSLAPLICGPHPPFEWQRQRIKQIHK